MDLMNLVDQMDQDGPDGLMDPVDPVHLATPDISEVLRVNGAIRPGVRGRRGQKPSGIAGFSQKML